MLRECIYGECAHEQHIRRTLTLTLIHTITAYSVSGNVVRMRILICATRQKPCRKRVYHGIVFFVYLCAPELHSTDLICSMVHNRRDPIFDTYAIHVSK